MKRLFSLLLVFLVILTLCACQGSYGGVNLKESMEIPANGIVGANIMAQIKAENAIGVFTGESEGLRYEWTIFGSDISEAEEINLAVQLSRSDDGDVQVKLRQLRAFSFSALLSVYLNEKWDSQSATAFAGTDVVASVSLTGSQTTVLNLMLDGSADNFEIRPDALPEDAYIPETEPSTEEMTQPTEDYLSKPQNGDGTVYTDGKDKYLTDPVPEGKPKPVEPEDQVVNSETVLTCTFSVECSTILNNLDMLDPDKLECVPSGGVILAKTTVTFHAGESVFDVLQRLCREKGIHMESSWTPIYNSAYIEGIHNLYEFDCGALSGWMYKVNGWYPNYGCSRYQLQNGDVVEWRYTCDLGNDVGGGYAVGG